MLRDIHHVPFRALDIAELKLDRGKCAPVMYQFGTVYIVVTVQ